MIANDFIKWLESKKFGTVGTNLFDTFQPDDPDNCITAYDVSAPGIDESSSLSVDLYGLQIIVRNTVASTAKATIKSINKKFIGFGGRPLITNGDRISSTYISAPAYCIGKDEKGRTEWTITYNVRVESKGDDYRL